MTLAQKVEKLNQLADNSLSITKYSLGWELNSYADKNLFNIHKYDKIIRADTFEELINKALKFAENKSK